MDENKLRIWDEVAQPPSEVLRPILGGRLGAAGLTEISPQWRYRAATQLWGPCGVGWKYEILSTEKVDGPDGQVFLFAKVALYYKVGEDWSEPVLGVGGSMLIAKEKDTFYANDEAVKMAVTDALSVAFKMLGFGAAVYMDQWDGSKYDVPFDFLPETTKDKVTDWIAKAEEAASDESFRKWWPVNKAAIIADCGEAGAATVYEQFTELLKKGTA